MAHSSDVREFVMSGKGIRILESVTAARARPRERANDEVRAQTVPQGLAEARMWNLRLYTRARRPSP